MSKQMKLKDYIEKRAASKRQLRLAKKFIEEANLASEKSKDSIWASKELFDKINLGEIGHRTLAKHRHGRSAAKAYATRSPHAGDAFVDLGRYTEDLRKRQMEVFNSKKMQEKAIRAFGKRYK